MDLTEEQTVLFEVPGFDRAGFGKRGSDDICLFDGFREYSFCGDHGADILHADPGSASSATVMDGILHAVVPCANTMEDIFEAALAYFDKIIDDFQAADIQLAVEAAKMGDDNDRDAPVNLPRR